MYESPLNYTIEPGECMMLTMFNSYSQVYLTDGRWHLSADDLMVIDDRYRRRKESCPVIVIASSEQVRLVISDEDVFWLGGGLKEVP